MAVKNKTIVILLVLVLLAGTSIYYAPCLLAYADKPVKADAIILFWVPSLAAREKEANLLLNEGYAKFLIVPTLQRVISTADLSPQLAAMIKNAVSSSAGVYPSYYEKTNLEVLQAKRIMDAMGLKSAIMVSSPYHMTRIKMICEKTFGEQARHMLYVPTSYEPAMTDLSHIDRADILPMMLEFAKIWWFYMYSFFSGQSNPGGGL